MKSLSEIYLSKWVEKSDTYVTMRGALDKVASILGGKDAKSFQWQDLRYENVRSVGAQLLASGLSVNTTNKLLSSLRGILEVANRQGLIPDEEYKRIYIKPERGKVLPAGRALSLEEMNLLAEGLILLEKQDAALLAILAGAGLRRIEASRIKKQHYDKEKGRITAFGKGNKARSVPVGVRWRKAFEIWWNAKATGELLFPFTRRQISYRVKKACEKLKMNHFTPHDLRRTFGTRVCEATDIIIAQRLLGHSDIKTTSLYDRRGDEAENEAVKDL